MSKKTGRNDYCPCGSGKKFKKCHLDKPTIVAPPIKGGPVLTMDMIRRVCETAYRNAEVEELIYAPIRTGKWPAS